MCTATTTHHLIINYENSTITIGTNSGDTSLYFSDKNKQKWETAMDAFVNGKCTMDISWVSVTKDYVMTFKGDKTVDDIFLLLIISFLLLNSSQSENRSLS